MTTTIKVHVQGRFRAHIAISHANGAQEDHVVEGEGERAIPLRQPADATIKVWEVPNDPVEDR
jgi:hypothetical protein